MAPCGQCPACLHPDTHPGGCQRRGAADQRLRQTATHLLYTSSYDNARKQHLSNLVFVLRHHAANRDWSLLAGAVATLMASDRAENLCDPWLFRHPGSRARLAEAMESGWLLLSQRPGLLSYEQSHRFLMQWAAFQLAPAGKDVIHLELARFNQAQGRSTDAWDFLSSEAFRTAAAEAERRALMGSIRMTAWAQVMQGAGAALPDDAQPLSSTSPNKRRRAGPPRSAGWQPWQLDARVWARGSRMAKELHQDALDCFKAVLHQQPDSGRAAQAVAQLQVAASDAKGALESIRVLQEQVPLSADVTALLAMLLGAQPEQSAQGEGEAEAVGAAPAVQTAECCCQLLALDPCCHAAAAALVRSSALQALPPGQLVAACACYLDAAPPSWLPPPLELAVWQLLACTLIQAAAAVAEQQQKLDQLQQQRQLLLPCSLGDVEQMQQQQAPGGAEAHPRWRQLQQLTTGALDAQQSLQAALGALQQCCSAMQGRLWWRDAHLLSQPASTILACLQSGAADAAALAAMAAVNAFLHPLWQQQVVQQWRAGGGASGLPRTLHNLMTKHTAAALGMAGHEQEARAVRTAAKLCVSALTGLGSQAPATQAADLPEEGMGVPQAAPDNAAAQL